MATKRTAAIGKLASVTKAPRITANPPSISTSMVDQAIRCAPGTPIAWRILANASGPLASLAKPCSIKPKPTIKRRGRRGQRLMAKPCKKSVDIGTSLCHYSLMSSADLLLGAQIENAIMERISDDSLQVGSHLPSEDSLLQEVGKVRATIEGETMQEISR